MNSLRIGIVPMSSTDDWSLNVKSCLRQLSFFEGSRRDLVVFPENSLYFNFSSQLSADDALSLSHPVWAPLQEWADKHDTYLHMGGVPLAEEGRVYNASVLITPGGVRQTVYRKIHLFDVDVDGITVSESRVFAAGKTPAVIDVRGWKVGLSICYDLRFSELFTHYHEQQVDLIVVPSSFLVPTGRAHWKTLLCARAIETQCYVAAPAQAGEHESVSIKTEKKKTWGQSLVINPWGEVLSESPSFDTGAALEPLAVGLDHELVMQTRRKIPMAEHREKRGAMVAES